MEIVVEARERGVAVIHVTGRLDLSAAAALKQGLLAAVAAGQHRLVVDRGATTFIDSSGLMALMDGLRAARLAGGDVCLARPGVQPRLLLQHPALDQVLRPYETVERALHAI